MSEPSRPSPPADASSAPPSAMPRSGEDLVLPGGVIVPASQVRFQVSRSSGPGGQNVNKLNTRVELWATVAAMQNLPAPAADRLRHMAGKRLTKADEVHLAAGQARSQEANRQAVIDRLGAMVAAALVEPRRRKKTRPSRAAKRRRLDSKKKQAEKKAGRSGPIEW